MIATLQGRTHWPAPAIPNVRRDLAVYTGRASPATVMIVFAFCCVGPTGFEPRRVHNSYQCAKRSGAGVGRGFGRPFVGVDHEIRYEVRALDFDLDMTRKVGRRDQGSSRDSAARTTRSAGSSWGAAPAGAAPRSGCRTSSSTSLVPSSRASWVNIWRTLTQRLVHQRRAHDRQPDSRPGSDFAQTRTSGHRTEFAKPHRLIHRCRRTAQRARLAASHAKAAPAAHGRRRRAPPMTLPFVLVAGTRRAEAGARHNDPRQTSATSIPLLPRTRDQRRRGMGCRRRIERLLDP
jgi:hypothetical protein